MPIENRFIQKMRNRTRVAVTCLIHGFKRGSVCDECVLLNKESGKIPGTAAIHIFKPFMAENLGSEDKLITSKKQYKEEARKIGGRPECL